MTKRILNGLLVCILWISILALALTHSPVQAQSQTPTVVTVQLNGPLNPTWKDILQRGIDLAKSKHAVALVIEINTTGGSIDLMTSLIQEMLASPVPVVTYVTPQGSMAASAGTLLVLAGRVSAMAPSTILGAASPVGAQGEDLSTTEQTKTKEALKATARSLVAGRGAAAIDLAEQAIDEAKAASADEAKKAGLIDIIAVNEKDLLTQLEGYTVKVAGHIVTLHTAGAALVETPVTPVETVLGLLADPNIVFILLAIGALAILIEITTPGGWVAGFTGAILLALGIYGLDLLPVNWVGIIFMAAAFVLYILDIKAHTHGALTAAGTASFIAGGLILFNSASVPDFANVSVGLVIGMGLFLGAVFFAVVLLAIRAMQTPLYIGKETLAGKEGYAVTAIAPSGIAQVSGEQWGARLAADSQPIAEGDRIQVKQVNGLKLIVSKVDDSSRQ